MQTIKPPRLKPGDTVGLVSPSQSVNDRLERFERAIPIFEKELDVKIKLGEHAMGEHWFHSGTLEERLADFHAMVADPDIKAIIFTVGGYTAVDLIDRLDYDLIRANPKIITGISDCTTILNPIYAKTGLITFHGLEFSFLGYPGHAQYMLDSLRQNFVHGGLVQVEPNPAWRDWRGTPTNYSGWQTIRPGSVSGRLLGGNLTGLMHWLDTPYSPDFENAILFVEAYRYDKRAIHAALADLRLRGVLDRIAGLIVGYCVGSDDPDKSYNQIPLKDVVLAVTNGYDFPIMQVGEIGHYVENAIMPIGAQASIDATNRKFTIEASVT